MDLPDAVGHPAFPSTLESLIRHHGGTILDIARDSLEREDVLEFEEPNPRILAPLHPRGLPIAMAPPFIFTLLLSIARSLIHAMLVAAKASLSSNKPISPTWAR